jgi:hypothetical protein
MIISVHSDWLLVAKKLDIHKLLVAKTCNKSSVGINISVQGLVAINLVGRYRFIVSAPNLLGDQMHPYLRQDHAQIRTHKQKWDKIYIWYKFWALLILKK